MKLIMQFHINAPFLKPHEMEQMGMEHIFWNNFVNRSWNKFESMQNHLLI